MEGSKRQEEGFLFSGLLFPCAHVYALVLMIPRLGTVRTLLYTRSNSMDSVCSNTKNFVVILIVISLGTHALHYHII